MPYAFNLTLDPQTNLEVERVYADLVALDVPEYDLVTQYGPCITILVVSDRVSPKVVVGVLEWKLPMMGALSITLTEPCVIHGTPPTLSLRVSPADELLALHNAIFVEMPEEEVHLYYRPAYWQPHLKLSNLHGDQAAAAKVVAAVSSRWKPLSGVLDHLEVMQYPPVQAIWQAPLRSMTPDVRSD